MNTLHIFNFIYFPEDKNWLEPVLLILLQLPALPGSDGNYTKDDKKPCIQHTLSMWYTGAHSNSKGMQSLYIKMLSSSLL